MSANCVNCKCSSCGNMHSCEIIMENVILSDKTHTCRNITECNNYTSKKDYVRHKNWDCKSLYGPDSMKKVVVL